MSKIRNSLKRTEEIVIERKDFLSSGSTRLNLACSGFGTGAIPKGTLCLFSGGSDSGKTFLGLNVLAEATVNKWFKGYQLRYANKERGAHLDIRKFFGNALADNLHIYAPTSLEDCYFSMKRAMQDGPIIELVDSLDALLPKAFIRTFRKKMASHTRGKEKDPEDAMAAKGRVNSRFLPHINEDIAQTGSIVIVICQTRANMGFTAKYEPDKRSGGYAITFFAQQDLWFKQKGDIVKEAFGKDRQQGSWSQIKVKRSRFTGKKREVIIPIYHSYGVDDIGSCIDFLVDEKYWRGKMDKYKKSAIRLKAPEFEYSGSREGLARKIQREGLEFILTGLVVKRWNEIEEACKLNRNPRYI